MSKPNKALHLNGLKAKQGLMVLRDIKTKTVVLGSFEEQITFLKKGRGEKGEESWGLQEVKL